MFVARTSFIICVPSLLRSPEKETDRLYGNVDVEQFVAALRDVSLH